MNSKFIGFFSPLKRAGPPSMAELEMFLNQFLWVLLRGLKHNAHVKVSYLSFTPKIMQLALHGTFLRCCADPHVLHIPNKYKHFKYLHILIEVFKTYNLVFHFLLIKILSQNRKKNILRSYII